MKITEFTHSRYYFPFDNHSIIINAFKFEIESIHPDLLTLPTVVLKPVLLGLEPSFDEVSEYQKNLRLHESYLNKLDLFKASRKRLMNDLEKLIFRNDNS